MKDSKPIKIYYEELSVIPVKGRAIPKGYDIVDSISKIANTLKENHKEIVSFNISKSKELSENIFVTSIILSFKTDGIYSINNYDNPEDYKEIAPLNLAAFGVLVIIQQANYPDLSLYYATAGAWTFSKVVKNINQILSTTDNLKIHDCKLFGSKLEECLKDDNARFRVTPTFSLKNKALFNGSSRRKCAKILEDNIPKAIDGADEFGFIVNEFDLEAPDKFTSCQLRSFLNTNYGTVYSKVKIIYNGSNKKTHTFGNIINDDTIDKYTEIESGILDGTSSKAIETLSMRLLQYVKDNRKN